MCLISISSNHALAGIGYKVFSVGETGNIFGLIYGGKYEQNLEYEDTNSQILGTLYTPSYPAGYHIFPNKVDAVAYAKGFDQNPSVFRVEYDKVVAVGKVHCQFRFYLKPDCVVARRMKILERVQQ